MTERTLATSVGIIGAEEIADTLPVDADADADTLVFLIWAICAIPAANTDADVIGAVIIFAVRGSSDFHTDMNADNAPEIVSRVAEAILNALIFFAFFSEFS